MKNAGNNRPVTPSQIKARSGMSVPNWNRYESAKNRSQRKKSAKPFFGILKNFEILAKRISAKTVKNSKKSLLENLKSVKNLWRILKTNNF